MSLLRIGDEAYWLRVEDPEVDTTPPETCSTTHEALLFRGSSATPLARLVACGPRTGSGFLETLRGQRIALLVQRSTLFPARIVAAVWVHTPCAPLVCGPQLWIVHEDGELCRYADSGCSLGVYRLLPRAPAADTQPEGIRAVAVQPLCGTCTYVVAWVSTRNRLWAGRIRLNVSDDLIRSGKLTIASEPLNSEEDAVDVYPLRTLPPAFAGASSLELCWLADGKRLSICSNTGEWWIDSISFDENVDVAMTGNLVVATEKVRDATTSAATRRLTSDRLRPGSASPDGRYCIWNTADGRHLLLVESSTTKVSVQRSLYRIQQPAGRWNVIRTDGLWLPSLGGHPNAHCCTFLRHALMQQPDTNTHWWCWSFLSLPSGVSLSIMVRSRLTRDWNGPGELVSIPEPDGSTLLWIQENGARSLARLQSVATCQRPLIEWGVNAPGVLLYEAFATRSVIPTQGQTEAVAGLRPNSECASSSLEPCHGSTLTLADLECLEDAASQPTSKAPSHILVLEELRAQRLLVDAAEQCVTWAFHTMANDTSRATRLLEAARWALAAACWDNWHQMDNWLRGSPESACRSDNTLERVPSAYGKRLALACYWWHRVVQWLRFRNRLATLMPLSAHQLQQPGMLRQVVGSIVRYAAATALSGGQGVPATATTRTSATSTTAAHQVSIEERISALYDLIEESLQLTVCLSRADITTAFAVALLRHGAAYHRDGCLQRAEQWIRALFLPASLAGEKCTPIQQALSERMAPFLRYAAASAIAFQIGLDRLAYELALTEPDPGRRIRALCGLSDATAAAQALQVFVGFYPRLSIEYLLIILDWYLERDASLHELSKTLQAYPMLQDIILTELNQRGDKITYAQVLRLLGRRARRVTEAPPLDDRIAFEHKEPSPGANRSRFWSLAQWLDWGSVGVGDQAPEMSQGQLLPRLRADLRQALQAMPRASTLAPILEECLAADWVRIPAKLLIAALLLDIMQPATTNVHRTRSELASRCLRVEARWAQHVALVLLNRWALRYAAASAEALEPEYLRARWMTYLTHLANLATRNRRVAASTPFMGASASVLRSAASGFHRHRAGHSGMPRDAFTAAAESTGLPWGRPASPLADWDRQLLLDMCLTIWSSRVSGAERETLRQCIRDVQASLEDEALRQTYAERWQRLEHIESVAPGQS
jgi:hypothetical protein